MRWYLRCRLRYADVVERLAERGVAVDRSAVYRRVRRFLSRFREVARAHLPAIGDRWRVGAIDCRLRGEWA